MGAVSKYSHSFRQQVAMDYEKGDLSYLQVAEKYGLKGRDTVKEWVKTFRKNGEICSSDSILATMTDQEKRDADAKDLRIKELERLLEDERLRSLAYSTMIDVAEEELGVPIRKSLGPNSPKDDCLAAKASIKRLCELFGYSRQAWYDHGWHVDDCRMREDEIVELVKNQRKNGRFGARTLLDMMGSELEDRGLNIGRDKLLDLLRERGMLVRPKRKHVRTTNSRHHYRKWPYLLENLGITQAEQVWVCDITYIRTKGGFLYLFLITDAYSHKVMGFHLSHPMEAKGAVSALRMALSQRIYPEGS